jgi:hypothetical protein
MRFFSEPRWDQDWDCHSVTSLDLASALRSGYGAGHAGAQAGSGELGDPPMVRRPRILVFLPRSGQRLAFSYRGRLAHRPPVKVNELARSKFRASRGDVRLRR